MFRLFREDTYGKIATVPYPCSQHHACQDNKGYKVGQKLQVKNSQMSSKTPRVPAVPESHVYAVLSGDCCVTLFGCTSSEYNIT